MTQVKLRVNPFGLLFLMLAVLSLSLPATANPCSPNVEVNFSLDQGETIADAQGTHFHFFGVEVDDFDLIYPPEYWGSFPLYFFGTSVGATVIITASDPVNCNANPDNNRDKHNPQLKPLKLWISNEIYLLNTDGTSGPELTAPRSVEMELLPGESKAFDASFFKMFQEGLVWGLNRMEVKIYKLKSNGKVGKILLVKEFIFG